MRIILAANHRTCSQDMRNRLSLLSLDSRRRFLKLLLAFKIVHNVNCPHQLQGYFVKRSELHGKVLKDSTLSNVIPYMGQSTLKCDAAREWNGLPREIRELNILSEFKTRIFNHFTEQDRINHFCSVTSELLENPENSGDKHPTFSIPFSGSGNGFRRFMLQEPLENLREINFSALGRSVLPYGP